MKEPNKFKEIYKLLQKLDHNSGLGLLRDRLSKRTWQEIGRLLNLALWLVNAFILTISTLVQSKFSLLSWIICGTALINVLLLTYLGAKFKLNKNIINSFLKWCDNLYEFETKFHHVIRDEAKILIENKQKWIFNALNSFNRILFLVFFGMTLGYLMIGLFLPENIYPKYTSPVPLYYPFEQQKTLKSFLLTAVGIVQMCHVGEALLAFCFSIFFCIVSHILTFMDVIKIALRKMKEELDFQYIVKIADEPCEKKETKPKKTLDVNTLREILQSIEEDTEDQPDNDSPDIENHTEPEENIPNQKLTFNEWVALITDMISDVNEIISQFNKFYSGYFLFAEIASVGLLFSSGMIFTVMHQQYNYGLIVLYQPFLLFLICFANEKILDKFDELKEQIYDLPWYAMTPKDRKTVLLMLQCDQIQKGFNAGSFHDLNNARFIDVLRLAYSNTLVLRDLINKSK